MKLDKEITANSNENKIIKEQTIQICIDKGGIPILSNWDSSLKDCLFK